MLLSARLNTYPPLAFISNIIFAKQIDKHEPDAHVCHTNRMAFYLRLSTKIDVWVLCMRCFWLWHCYETALIWVSYFNWLCRSTVWQIEFLSETKRGGKKTNLTMCYWLQCVKVWFEFSDILLYLNCDSFVWLFSREREIEREKEKEKKECATFYDEAKASIQAK